MSSEQDAKDLQAQIVEYMHEEFRIEKSNFDTDVKLVRTGLLDSVHLVQLATWLEQTFDISIPDRDIDVDHLDSVAMIVGYVQDRIQTRVESQR